MSFKINKMGSNSHISYPHQKLSDFTVYQFLIIDIR